MDIAETISKERKNRLKGALANSLNSSIALGRRSIETQEEASKSNPNYPTPLESAKCLLYRAHILGFVPEVSTAPFQNPSEIYSYIEASLNTSSEHEKSRHEPAYIEFPPRVKPQRQRDTWGGRPVKRDDGYVHPNRRD